MICISFSFLVFVGGLVQGVSRPQDSLGGAEDEAGTGEGGSSPHPPARSHQTEAIQGTRTVQCEAKIPCVHYPNYWEA